MLEAELSQEAQMGVVPAAEAVEALICDYGRLIFHVIHSMTGDWEESQDLTQEVFLRALQAIDAARAESGGQFHAKAWLVHIATNQVRMWLRRRRLVRFVAFSQIEQTHLLEQEAPDVPAFLSAAAMPAQPAGYGTPEEHDPAQLIAERDAVDRTLAKLPEGLRLPLLLSIVAGLSMREIARVLGLSEEAVRQRLSRARRTFQALYACESGEQVTDNEAPKRQSRMAARASGSVNVHSLQSASARQ